MTDSMETSQESQAPTTESSNKPHPIPPVPPIPNPSPLIAPPPPPPNLEPTKTTDSRHILKPIAPSKLPVTERPTKYSSDNTNMKNAFLPKELAEIVAIRQRRERAWHASLVICTTVFSSIESTLANFKDDIEKEEVVAFKAYLKLAIANFAAVDTSPNPPKIPLHSRSKKYISYGVGNDKTAGKKIAVAVPRNILSTESSAKKAQETFNLSKTPKTVENTWATVARNVVYSDVHDRVPQIRWGK